MFQLILLRLRKIFHFSRLVNLCIGVIIVSNPPTQLCLQLPEGLYNVPTLFPTDSWQSSICQDKSIYALNHYSFGPSTQLSLKLHEGLGNVPTPLPADQNNISFAKTSQFMHVVIIVSTSRLNLASNCMPRRCFNSTYCCPGQSSIYQD